MTDPNIDPSSHDTWLQDMTQPRLWSFVLGISVGIVAAGVAVGRLSLGALDRLTLSIVALAVIGICLAWFARRRLLAHRPHGRVSSSPLPSLMAGIGSLLVFADSVRSARAVVRDFHLMEQVSGRLLGAFLIVALVWTLWLLFYELKLDFTGKH